MSQAPHAAPPDTGGTGKTLGIVSIVCGGVGVCVPGLGLLGLVLGLVGVATAGSGRKKLPAIGAGVGGAALVLNLVLMVLILIPSLNAARQAVQMQQEMVQLRELGMYTTAYATDHKDMMPRHASDLEAAGYIVDPSIFTAPPADPAATVLPTFTGDPTKPYTYGSFTFTPLGGYVSSDFRDPTATIVAYSDQPRGPDAAYRAVLFLDGHVEMVPEAELSQRLAEHERNMPPEDRRRLHLLP